MRVAVVGQKWLGAEALAAILARGHEVPVVVAPTADDRLAEQARAAGLRAVNLDGRRRVDASDIGGPVDLVVAAHAHAFVAAGACALARRGAIGYHPSLLPLYRGVDAVEATIAAGERVAGGTVYHLTTGMDTGPTVFQDWCFVREGDTAASLWRRELAPMGLGLLMRAVETAAAGGALPAIPQAVGIRP